MLFSMKHNIIIKIFVFITYLLRKYNNSTRFSISNLPFLKPAYNHFSGINFSFHYPYRLIRLTDGWPLRGPIDSQRG